VKLFAALPGDVSEFFDHLQRHFRESGKEGDPIFHPVPDFESWDKEKMCAELKKKWAAPLNEPWERAWILRDGNQIVGHATLRGGFLAAGLHRCIYAIGLERSARGLGLGRALTLACRQWAATEAGLEWIDLRVFSHNKPARKLYDSLGFEFIGETKDMFRVNGESIDDIHMVLRLK
jgi:RimJ/RimL family protein N-acetyltransferase